MFVVNSGTLRYSRTAHKFSPSANLPSNLYIMYSWPIRETSSMFRHFTSRRPVNKWMVEPMREKRTCILTTFLRINCLLVVKNLYDIHLMYVQSWTPDDRRKDRPKHVEWYSINPKIVHLVGFTIEMKTMHSLLCEKFVEKRKIQNGEEKNIVSL
jgi:hypothetical protein